MDTTNSNKLPSALLTPARSPFIPEEQDYWKSLPRAPYRHWHLMNGDRGKGLELEMLPLPFQAGHLVERVNA